MRKLLSLKAVSVACILLSPVLVSTNAFAGYKYSAPVQVDSTSISGSFGAARNSASPREHLYFVDYGNRINVVATDAAGITKGCTMRTEPLLTQLRSAQSDSQITVGWDSSGACTYVFVNSGSSQQPKAL